MPASTTSFELGIASNSIITLLGGEGPKDPVKAFMIHKLAALHGGKNEEFAIAAEIGETEKRAQRLCADS